jgi:catalase
MANTVKDSIATRKVAILAADGVDDASLARVTKALAAEGAQGKIVAPRLGQLVGAGGEAHVADFSLLTAASVLFDAVFIPGGQKSVQALSAERDAVEFVTEAFRHCKTIGAMGEGVDLLRACPGLPEDGDPGVIAGSNGQIVKRFVEAMAEHRHWTRKGKNRLVVPPGGDETRGRKA